MFRRAFVAPHRTCQLARHVPLLRVIASLLVSRRLSRQINANALALSRTESASRRPTYLFSVSSPLHCTGAADKPATSRLGSASERAPPSNSGHWRLRPHALIAPYSARYPARHVPQHRISATALGCASQRGSPSNSCRSYLHRCACVAPYQMRLLARHVPFLRDFTFPSALLRRSRQISSALLGERQPARSTKQLNPLACAPLHSHRARPSAPAGASHL